MSLVELARAAIRQPRDRIMSAVVSTGPITNKPDPVIVGLHLGAMGEPSALALLRSYEVQESGRRRRYYDCPLLEKIPARTPYSEIVEDVRRLFEEDEQLEKQPLVMNVSDVGHAIGYQFPRAKVRARIIPIVITGTKVTPDQGGWQLPIRELVGVLHVLLGTPRLGSDQRILRVASDSPAARELPSAFEKFTARANASTTTVEPWRAASGEELPLVLGIAGFFAERCQRRLAIGL